MTLPRSIRRRRSSPTGTWTARRNRRSRRSKRAGWPRPSSRSRELEKMLDQLRNARTKPSDGKQANSKRQRGKQQMGVVQDMIGREAGLLDHAQRRGDQADAATPPGASPDNPPPAPKRQRSTARRSVADGQPPAARANPAAEREADRRVQQALRRALGELMQQFGDMTGQVPPSLGEADQAMRDAMRAPGSGQRSRRRAVTAAGDRGAAERRPGDGPGDGKAVSAISQVRAAKRVIRTARAPRWA